MVARLLITLARDEGEEPYPTERYVIDGAKLRATANVMRQLRELGWTEAFDDGNYVDEGYFEFGLTKPFAYLGLAAEEVATVEGATRVRNFNGSDYDALLNDEFLFRLTIPTPEEATHGA
jgi:hypothetical protein